MCTIIYSIKFYFCKKSNNAEKLIGKKKIELSRNKKERLFKIKKSVSDLLKFKNSEIHELTPEQELILEKNITWLFGAARSGTTWLALELLSYSTKRISEPLLERHLSVPAGIQDLRFIDNPQKNPSYFFSEEYKKTWMFFLRKLILNRIFSEVQSIDKKIIIKELVTWGGCEILSECLKNSKIIILLRDGRDVVDSAVEATSQDGFMTKKLGLNKKSRPANIIGQSKIWTLATKDLLKTYDMKPKDLRYKIKYEDLRKNTLQELEKIYKFIEIDVPKDELQEIVTKFTFENLPPEQKGPGKFARSATPGKWKENFNDEEKKVMEEIMGPTLRMLGY